jgi:hypothetical protein
MRPGILLVLGSLAMVGLASLSQSSAAQMAIFMPQPPPVQFRGCVYYQDVPWAGKWRSIAGGTRRRYVGDSWNELISSFSCNPACHVVAFQDRDFQGARGEFGTIMYVGEPWNDKISSLIAVCKHPF